MKTVHNYLARELAVAIGLAVAVFGFALLFGQVIRQLQRMLNQYGVLPTAILPYVPLLLPYVLMFALPMAVMTGVLLVFGKLSADREIMAMRAGGMSLAQLVWPVYLMALLLTLLCIYLNTTVGPWGKEQFRNQVVAAALRAPEQLLQPGQTTRFGEVHVYVEKRNGHRIENVKVFEHDEEGRLLRTLHAVSGTFTTDPQKKHFSVELFTVKAEAHDPSDPTNPTKIKPGIEVGSLALELTAEKFLRTGATKQQESDLTFQELLNAIDREQTALASGQPTNPKAPRKRLGELLLEAQRRFSWALGCFVFTLLGVPLGIRAHRSETSANAAVALLLVAPYYFLTYWAGRWQEHSLALASVWLWLPNLIFAAIGIAMLWRMSRR